MDYRCRLSWLGNSSTASGSSVPGATVGPRYSSAVGIFFLCQLYLFPDSLFPSNILLYHFCTSLQILPVVLFTDSLVTSFIISPGLYLIPFSGSDALNWWSADNNYNTWLTAVSITQRYFTLSVVCLIVECAWIQRKGNWKNSIQIAEGRLGWKWIERSVLQLLLLKQKEVELL